MATWEDFDSDIDEELLNDVIALPSNSGNMKGMQSEAVEEYVVVTEDKKVQFDTSEMDATSSGVPTFSSDQLLKDSERKNLCLSIQKAWQLHGKENLIVKQLSHKLFSASHNSHLSAAFLMYHSPDFLKNQNNSLAFFAMNQFEIWLREFHKLNGCYPEVERQTAVEVLLAVSHQKNRKLLQKVVKLYNLHVFKEHLTPIVNKLIKEQSFNTACQMAIELKLFDNFFKKEDFILPLIIQDKILLVEEYLKNNKSMQKDVVLLLDQHVKNPCDMIPLIAQYIPNVNYEKLHPSSITNLVFRLAKSFELGDEFYPQCILRRNMGSLRYLVKKKYFEKSIDDENWEELVDIAVKNSVELQVELVNLLSECLDDKAAVEWALRYAVPEENLPYHLTPLTNTKMHSLCKKIEAAETLDYANSSFHTLKLPMDRIKWVSTWKGTEECLAVVLKEKVIAFDTEWQPTFGGRLAVAAILQIATHDQVFLLDVHSLRANEKLSIDKWKKFNKALFENSSILKLGFGIKEDLQILSRSMPGVHNISKSIQNVTDVHCLWSTIQNKYPFICQAPNGGIGKGLCGLVEHLFGLPLDKREQISNWERRPLRLSQLVYAALDAFCLLEIYDYLLKQTKKFGLDSQTVLGISDTFQLSERQEENYAADCFSLSPSFSSVRKDQFGYKSSSDVRFVCDSGLHHLGELLRSCGIDTVILTNEDSSHACAHLALKENRLILTGKTLVKEFKQRVGDTRVFNVLSDHPAKQVLEVVEHFKILVKEGDIFSRCTGCNSNLFHRLDREQFVCFIPGFVIPFKSPEGKNPSPFPDKSWVLVDAPREINRTMLTSKGSRIQINDVPEDVVSSTMYLHVCVNCGKCYWEGSQPNEILSESLDQVLHWSGSNN